MRPILFNYTFGTYQETYRKIYKEFRSVLKRSSEAKKLLHQALIKFEKDLISDVETSAHLVLLFPLMKITLNQDILTLPMYFDIGHGDYVDKKFMFCSLHLLLLSMGGESGGQVSLYKQVSSN